jgi:hypothetical protein
VCCAVLRLSLLGLEFAAVGCRTTPNLVSHRRDKASCRPSRSVRRCFAKVPKDPTLATRICRVSTSIYGRPDMSSACSGIMLYTSTLVPSVVVRSSGLIRSEGLLIAACWHTAYFQSPGNSDHRVLLITAYLSDAKKVHVLDRCNLVTNKFSLSRV